MKTNYLKSFCARCLTLLVLALLSTNLAWGAEVVLTGTSGFSSSYGETAPDGFSGSGICYNAKNTPSGWAVKQVIQFRKSGSGAGTLYNTTALTSISNIKVYLVQNDNDFTIKHGTSSNPTTSSIQSKDATKTTESVSYTNTNNASASCNASVYSFDLSASKPSFFSFVNGTGANYVYKIVITYSAKTPETVTVSGSPTKTEYYVGDKFDPAGLTVTATYEEGDPETITSGITWTITPETFTSTTQTSVSVTATVGDVDSSPYPVNGLTVKTIANTKETAYTVAQAKELIDAGNGLNTEVYVKGTVSQVDGLNDDGTITYWLDNNAFEVYKGKGIDNASFTSKDDVKYDAKVIVYGKIKKYSSTYEFDAGNYLVSYADPAKDLPTITLTYKTPLVVGESGEYTVEYNGNGEISIESSNTEVATATINEKTVSITAKAAGTTTIKISAAETDAYFPAEEVYTLTVIAPASLPFAFDGGIGDIKNENGMAQSGLGDDYKSAPLLKFDGTGDNLVIRFDGQADYVSYDIQGKSFSNGTFDVMESADGEEYTLVESYTTLGNTTVNKLNALKSVTRYVKFVYTSKSSGNVALGNINIGKAYKATITDAKYATLGLPYAVEIPDGVSAYTATVEGTTVTMTKISAIPANCGVILYAETPGDYTFTQTLPPNLAVTNKLVAVIDETYTCGDDYGKDYYLGLSNGQATFKKLNAGGTIAAGKAYLKLDAALPDGAKLEITFGEPTGIESLTPALSEGNEVYNLNGMRVNPSTGSGQAYKAYKGIVIMNGKKYINK